MNEIPDLIRTLQANGWSLAAIGRELDVHSETLSRWGSGTQRVAHRGLVIHGLTRLVERQDVPSKKRFGDNLLLGDAAKVPPTGHSERPGAYGGQPPAGWRPWGVEP